MTHKSMRKTLHQCFWQDGDAVINLITASIALAYRDIARVESKKRRGIHPTHNELVNAASAEAYIEKWQSSLRA